MRAAAIRCVALCALAAACMPPKSSERTPNNTLVIGIDVSGSFRAAYGDAIDFAAHYIYAHVKGLGGLRVPTALFVGSVGGAQPGETKAFHPIHDFSGKSVEQIAADLQSWFPPEDNLTDFNAFFQRVAALVKERGLVLAPLNVVLLSDGVNDITGQTRRSDQTAYAGIDLQPLEFLSRSVTVRLLYATPTVADRWKREIDRRRVRIWTVEAPVMRGWRAQWKPDRVPEEQQELWKWIQDNVDFRVRSRQLL